MNLRRICLLAAIHRRLIETNFIFPVRENASCFVLSLSCSEHRLRFLFWPALESIANCATIARERLQKWQLFVGLAFDQRTGNWAMFVSDRIVMPGARAAHRFQEHGAFAQPFPFACAGRTQAIYPATPQARLFKPVSWSRPWRGRGDVNCRLFPCNAVPRRYI